MKILFISMALMFAQFACSQSIEQLSLSKAQDLGQKNYPAIKRKDLINQTASISIDNLQKGFLPQINILAQASYQSDVTKIPFSFPGFDLQTPGKDQYKLLADVNQLLYDGGITKTKKDLQQLNASVEQQKLEVELYQVREKINQLYLGILLIDQQLEQVKLVSDDIQSGINKVDAQVRNGLAFKANLNLLKAELLKTSQRNIELTAARKGWMDALSLFLGMDLDPKLKLERPSNINSSETIDRPEIKLYDQQSIFIKEQGKLIDASARPRAGLFGQAGYARPGLNLLKNDFAVFYIAGFRLNWSLNNLYTRKKDRMQLEINQKIIETQKQSFLLQTNAQLKQERSDIDKFEKLLASDQEIIDLRHSVTEASRAQLANAVITANDYLNQVNAEDQARQLKIFHEIQLIQAQLNYQTTLGGKF